MAAECVASESTEPDGIMAVRENGKIVYVNAPRPRKAAAQARPQRSSVLVYWNAREKTWKPVPPPSPVAMRQARSAAEEVANFVGSRPQAVARQKGNAVVTNPNYRELARGRAVSTREIDTAIEQASRKHGVDPNLVRAIIKVESNFNPKAVSPKGAMGLMQLMPGTARDLNVNDPFDPRENVNAGVRYFKNLMNNFGGDVRLSLAAYNAGPKTVALSKGVPRIAETQNYVKQITGMYWNGTPAVTFQSSGTRSLSPVRMFRNSDGRLVLTNQD